MLDFITNVFDKLTGRYKNYCPEVRKIIDDDFRDYKRRTLVSLVFILVLTLSYFLYGWYYNQLPFKYGGMISVEYEYEYDTGYIPNTVKPYPRNLSNPNHPFLFSLIPAFFLSSLVYRLLVVRSAIQTNAVKQGDISSAPSLLTLIGCYLLLTYEFIRAIPALLLNEYITLPDIPLTLLYRISPIIMMIVIVALIARNKYGWITPAFIIKHWAEVQARADDF